MQSLKNGTQLGGYTLIRMIARGGMGEVYEAHEAKLQRKVALKVIAPTNPDEHDRDDLIRRFMQEARTLARVNHPNVVTIYAIDNSGGIPFIAMEYVEGCSFRQLLEELTFTIDGAISLFLQMTEGLKSLHDNRIVHRDLKPHNVLLRPDGQVKILDFGIAKHVGHGDNTRVGVIVGTLPYMAPELKNGSPASMRSDLWSLGAIFFECLTGKRLIECLPDREIEYPEEALSKIPPEFRAILNKMCAHKVSDRYLMAEQVIDDLRAFQQSRPPVPAAVWSSLAKRVEALAKAKREEQDQQAPPVTPRPISGTAMIKGETDAPTRIVRHHTGRRKVKRSSTPGLPRVILFGVALLVGVGIYLKATLNSGIEKTPPPVANNDGSRTDTSPAKPDKVKPGTPLALKDPANQQLLWLEPTRIPTLAWSQPVDGGLYQIQIATDAKFKNIIVQEPVSGNVFRPERVLPEGKYHWRLSARKPGVDTIGPATFTVALLTAPDLISPEPYKVFDGIRSRGELDFTWTCKTGAKLYLAQIATDPEFRGLTQEKMLKTCKWDQVRLVPGTYYWRVRIADVPSVEDVWSRTRQVTLKAAPGPAAPAPVQQPARPRIPDLALAEPKIKTPSITHTLSLTGRPRDLASLRNNVVQLPELEWRPVKNAQKYVVQFSTSREFTHLLSEEIVSGTRLEWRGVVPGHAYWRVAAMAPNGETGPFSNSGHLNVLLPAPQINAAYKFTLSDNIAGGNEVTLNWSAVPLASKYIVQFGPRRDLAGADERTSKSSKLSLSVPAGKYYMRVAAADEAGEAISAFSNVATVDVESEFALEKPQPLSPKTGARAPSKAGRISVVFSWSKVNGAEGYTFEIASDPEFKFVIDRRESKNRGTLLQQAELKGRVYWRVRANSAKGMSDWSEASYFDVK